MSENITGKGTEHLDLTLFNDKEDAEFYFLDYRRSQSGTDNSNMQKIDNAFGDLKGQTDGLEDSIKDVSDKVETNTDDIETNKIDILNIKDNVENIENEQIPNAIIEHNTSEDSHKDIRDSIDSVSETGNQNKEDISNVKKDLNDHKVADNPHGIDKEIVGLGDVENYPIATTREAEAGEIDNAYMTPKKVHQAIKALGGGGEGGGGLTTTEVIDLIEFHSNVYELVDMTDNLHELEFKPKEGIETEVEKLKFQIHVIDENSSYTGISNLSYFDKNEEVIRLDLITMKYDKNTGETELYNKETTVAESVENIFPLDEIVVASLLKLALRVHKLLNDHNISDKSHIDIREKLDNKWDKDDLVIGGRNYLTQEEQNRIAKYNEMITTDSALIDGVYQHKIVALTEVTIRAAIPEYDYGKLFNEDDELIVSCDIKTTEELSVKLDYSTTQEYIRVPADRWFRVHSKIKYGDRIGIYSEDRASEGTVVELKNYKLERGTVSTDWTPALEDNDVNVDEIINKHNTDDKAHENIINKLPQYEVGIFKPTIVGLEVTGDNSYSVQSGFYTRIGNRIFIDLTVTLSSKDDNMKGLAVISGLPFISSDNGDLRPSISLGEVHFVNLPSGAWQISGRVQPSTSWITLTTFRSGASGGAITANDINDKTSIRLSGCYVIN